MNSLIGLALGLTGGILIGQSTSHWPQELVGWVEPVGALWVNALRMTIVPLVVANLVVATVTAGDGRRMGKIGLTTLGVFVILLLMAGIFAVSMAPFILGILPLDPETIEAVALMVQDTGDTGRVASAPPKGLVSRITSLIPRNLFAAAANEELLPLIIATVLFAFAMAQIPQSQRRVLTDVFRAVALTMNQLIKWILHLAPVGVFALALSLTSRTGLGGAGALIYFVLLLSGLLLAFAVLLYPLTRVFGRIPIHRFAITMSEPQMVAISTRSSLATLPSLLESVKSLRLSDSISSFVLPLSVSTFKVHRTISDSVELFFLAHLFGISLEVSNVATFFFMALILSFSSAGIPSGGFGLSTLPAFLAIGIPMEGVLLLAAVDIIPDVFKTLLNVTGDMSATAVVARLVGSRSMPDVLQPIPLEQSSVDPPITV